jgi:CRP-like cAMP-binding protein
MEILNFFGLLQLNTLFNNFSINELSALLNITNHKIKNYNKNTVIHFESEKCLTLDIILQGQILIQRIDENGNVLTVSQFTVGNSIGGNLLFSRNNFYPMCVLAKTACTILHINKNLVLELCQNNKSFLLEFLLDISDKTYILTNKIKTISMKSLRASIIDFLKYEYYYQKNVVIKLHVTKKELAERIGVQRTSLSRELNKMKSDGLIDYDKKTITIKDLTIIFS